MRVTRPVAAPTPQKKKLTYKEQREFEGLEKEIAALDKERQEISLRLNSASLGFDEVQQLSARIGQIADLIDEKELRWLELSESGS